MTSAVDALGFIDTTGGARAVPHGERSGLPVQPRFRQPRVDSAPLRERLIKTAATHYRISQLASVSPRFVKDLAIGRTKTLSRPYCEALMAAVAQAERELANRVPPAGLPP